jgi:opacity protein-like surface antigen
MTTAIGKSLAAALTAAVLLASPAMAADKEKETADTIMTVYVSAHGGSSMARKINESHVAMEAAGWRFADLEIHTENGDTEGAWITYTK